MVRKFQFGSEAITYIRSCLSQGGHLANYLLKIPLDGGQTISFLPENISDKAAQNFTVGGITPPGVSFPISFGVAVEIPRTETAEILIILIQKYLNIGGMRFAVFESQTARPEDPWLAKTDLPFFTYGTSVFFYFTPDNLERAIIRKARSFASFPFVGLLTSLPDEIPRIDNRRETTDDMLKLLAKRTEHILVGAYDNEGELIWSRLNVAKGEQGNARINDPLFFLTG